MTLLDSINAARAAKQSDSDILKHIGDANPSLMGSINAAMKANQSPTDILSHIGIANSQSNKIQTVDQYATEQARSGLTAEANSLVPGANKDITISPIAPATVEDLKMGAGYNPLKVAGKTIANVFSDAPSILQGLAESVIHPVDAVKGMANYYAGIASEAFNSIKEGIKTGDWTRVQNDVQKAEVSVIDHPLQAILAFEGAKDLGGGAVEAIKNPVKTAGTIVDKGVINPIENFKKAAAKDASVQGKPVSYWTQSALHNRMVDLTGMLDQKTAQLKTIDDLQGKLKSFSDKSSTEYQKTATDLQIAKNQLDDLNKAQQAHAQGTAVATQAQMERNGYASSAEYNTDINSLLKKSKEDTSQIYEQNLGDTPIPLKGVIDGLNNLKTFFKNTWDTATADRFNGIVNKATISDLVRQYGDNESKLQDELANNSDIIPKKYLTQDSKFVSSDKGTYNTETGKLATQEELAKGAGTSYDLNKIKQDFPPPTSNFIRNIRNNIRSTISPDDVAGFEKFNELVDPAFKSAFEETMAKTEDGQAKLEKVKAADSEWKKIRESPFVTSGQLTDSAIIKNWSSFTEAFKPLVAKFQNYIGSKILNSSETNGEYSATKIQNGIKKYEDILPQSMKDNLNSIATMIEHKPSEISAAEAKVSTLEEKQAKVQADMKSIGTDPSEIEKNIMAIDSMDKLNSFLDKSGKTIDELRAPILQALIEQSDKEAGKPTDANYDVTRLDLFVKKVNDLGGKTSGGQGVNDAILGPMKDTFTGIEKANTELQALKELKDKHVGVFARIISATLGSFLISLGIKWKGALEIKKALQASRATAEDAFGRERPIKQTPVKEKVGAKVKKITKKAGDIIKNPNVQEGAVIIGGGQPNDNQNQ